MDDLNLLTGTEAADALDLSWTRVNSLIRTGRLHAVKLGNRWFVPAAEVERFAAIPRPTGRHLNDTRPHYAIVRLGHHHRHVYRLDDEGLVDEGRCALNEPGECTTPLTPAGQPLVTGKLRVTHTRHVPTWIARKFEDDGDDSGDEA